MRWSAIAVLLVLTGGATIAAEDRWSSAPARPGGDVVMRIVSVEDEDENPLAAGKAAAEALKRAMGPSALKVVLVSECFEDRENKEKTLKGITSVLPETIVVGGATYGSFTQDGCTDYDSVCLLGIGGDGIAVSAALVTDLGTAKLTYDGHQAEIQELLHTAGRKLAEKLRRTDQDRLLILVADAHAPKNQSLVEGMQQVVGKPFPITGGCANKNAGQTFVYFGGKAHPDSAVALMLAGDFRVALSGRQANENEKVIATARDGAQEALSKAGGKPIAVLAFNCAGRRSKLKKHEDELAAMQSALGEEVPLFGCYCAGEIGPVDMAEKGDAFSGGAGWHVMFTVLTK
ncbi:MAG: FIST C-terminal domain-containing protein [Pirellulales bacterium]|nr:FIST C-terminal domain-containing protein [Pirellulales bacterium]